MLDLERLDFREVMMGRGMIEKLREREAEVNQANPVQVAQDNALPCFALCRLDQLHLLVEIAPDLAVVDHAIDPGPELRVDRGAEFLLPPKIEREIGIELGKDNVRQQAALLALERKRKLLRTDLLAAGAADVAMRADPGFDPALLRRSGRLRSQSRDRRGLR